MSAHATVRGSVADARAAAHRRVEEQYNALVDKLEQCVGDVVHALLPPEEMSMNLVARFPDKLCVLPNKSIDSDVMEILKPKLVKHAADSNEMVVEICYAPGRYPSPQSRPPWIVVLKGDVNDPRCKSWYHILKVHPDNLATAVDWAKSDGKPWGANLRVTRLPARKVGPDARTRLEQLRALVLVDAVTQEPLATVPHQPKRLRRLVDDDED